MNLKQVFVREIELLLVMFLIIACSGASPTELSSTSMPTIPFTEAPSTSPTELSSTGMPTIPSTEVPSSLPNELSLTAMPTIHPTEAFISASDICGDVTFTTTQVITSQVPSGEIITRENASQVTQIDVRGKGDKVGWGPLAFSPNGDILVSVHYEGQIKLYDMASGNLLGEIKSNLGWIGNIEFSPDGKLIAVGGGNYDPKGIGVEIWDSVTLEQKYVLEDFNEPVLDLEFSPDGTLLATADSNSWGCCASVKLWNVKTGELVGKLPVLQDIPEGKAVGVFDIAFNPEGTLLAAIRSDGKVVLVDVASQKIIGNMTGVAGWGSSVAINPDGNLLAASGSADSDGLVGDLRLWNLLTGELLFKLIENGFRIDNVAFNVDGTVLASSSICLRLWDVKTGESLKVLNGAFVTDFAFSPDGTLLATKEQDNLIRIWGVPSH